ncbi:hypothetical protein ACFIOY_38740 [Bradyrhizobium sp. TZ2]
MRFSGFPVIGERRLQTRRPTITRQRKAKRQEGPKANYSMFGDLVTVKWPV